MGPGAGGRGPVAGAVFLKTGDSIPDGVTNFS